MILVSLFTTISLMNQWIIFFIIIISCIFVTLPPCIELQKIPYWYFPVVGFIKDFYRLWLQQCFKWFTAWNTRFSIHIICIIVFTCNVYINFLPFVGVSTCSVQLLLSISRTHLFKQIIDSIQGLMFFPIFLVKLNYFLGKTFRLIIQIMTIWNSRSPNIFQLFREVKKICSVTCLT